MPAPHRKRLEARRRERSARSPACWPVRRAGDSGSDVVGYHRGQGDGGQITWRWRPRSPRNADAPSRSGQGAGRARRDGVGFSVSARPPPRSESRRGSWRSVERGPRTHVASWLSSGVSTTSTWKHARQAQEGRGRQEDEHRPARGFEYAMVWMGELSMRASISAGPPATPQTSRSIAHGEQGDQLDHRLDGDRRHDALVALVGVHGAGAEMMVNSRHAPPPTQRWRFRPGPPGLSAHSRSARALPAKAAKLKVTDCSCRAM